MEGKKSVLGGVPKSLPALVKAIRLQEKSKTVGFEWDNTTQVWDKCNEELHELEEATKTGLHHKIEEEMGDVLLAASNMARMLGVDAENALRLSSRKFEKRFERVEQLLAKENLSLEVATLAQMDAAWEAAKLEEKTKTQA